METTNTLWGNPLWVDAFAEVLGRCAIGADETVLILAETSTAPRLLALSQLALGQLKRQATVITVPSPAEPVGAIVKSSGATQALSDQALALSAMKSADVVIDLTLEGLMHAPQTPSVLQSGTRIMTISNEHPEALSRLIPSDDDKAMAKEAVGQLRAAKSMQVTSSNGTDLTIDMQDAATVGVWGWTDRPGTLAHWPGGLVVSFPKAGSVQGRLVMAPGDMNLTFKRYIETAVEMTITDDYIESISGDGADAALMKDYLASFGEREAYATSHVGWGLNPNARYEALTMYDKADTNGTELRALRGNFLYSTGANEFAGRFTRGHFDLPMMGCDIALDGTPVIAQGRIL